MIVDEVTMVTPALCVFLASRATDRFLLAGDPRQLGPIFEGDAADPEQWFWLAKDVFELSGVSKGDGDTRQIITTDSRLARITAQRRCAPTIWDKVANLYPQVHNAANIDRLRILASLPPAPDSAVVILDTTQTPARCENSQRSWQNTFTAEVAMEVATTIAAEATGSIAIAIISPYRAQVRLLRNLLRAEWRANATPMKDVKVEAGTVHQFQGSEADVVIVDLVDGRGRDGLGHLLRSDVGMRLVNVAMTRAKGKLVVIADLGWFHQAHLDIHNRLLQNALFGQSTGMPMRTLPVAPAIPSDDEDGTQTESPIEELLLEAMREHAQLATVELQYRIYNRDGMIVSRADFAFPSLKYAVYCDGRQWHLQKDRWQRDLRQRNALTALGWKFSVFTGREIYRDSGACAIQVLQTLLALSQQE